jgi:type IV secretion system protein TrbL
MSSRSIIDRSVQDGEFGENLVRLLTVPVAGTLARVLVIVLGLVSVFVSLVQIGLMVARNGMLVILAGVLPTSGSFTSTEIGKAQFQKLVAWLIAFMLYKPAAAIVYATALSGVNLFGDEGLISLVTGMVLMVLAVLALPALMRFAGPVVGAVASDGGGGGQVAAAGATVAAGAIPVSRGSSGGGWDAAPSGGGGTEPSGAAGVGGAPGPHGQGSDQGPSGAHSSNGAGGESANGGGGGGCGVEQRHRATARSGPRGAGVATLRGGRGDGRIWRVVAVWGMGRRSAVRWAVGRWSGGWVWARGLGSRAMGCLSTTGA